MRAHVEVLVALELNKIQCFGVQILKISVKITQGSNSEILYLIAIWKYGRPTIRKISARHIIAKVPH